ncbi:uncharacterized protein LOC126562898 [Anopheles maculipalpis]|uniref:uncharacterized protein LOC126562898 n=1 Tax=Anopheles maculipalpis TaxID=1496333 RepID=UPI002158D19E|nr:uncharacterized protein LOC126562898 [Anopheles maculipalpis]
MDTSSVNRKTGKSAKTQKAEDTVPILNIGKPLQLKQSKARQNIGMEMLSKKLQHSTTTTRSSTARSDSSSYMDSEDSCDSSRLQIAWDADNNETQSNHSERSESSDANSFNYDTQALMHLKSSLETRPLKRWGAAVTLQNGKIPLFYHKSMARQFPTKERTPEQMEMRRRNTEAARLSRAKMKMAELMMEKEATELSTENTGIKQMIASQLVYANELRKLLNKSSIEFNYFKRVGNRNSDFA